VDRAHAVVDSAQEELWRGLPSSNVYKQRRLAGWSDADEGGSEDGALELRTHLLEADRYAELRAFLDGSGKSFNAVMLGVYHLVLQGYLDDVESLIGCCLLEIAQPAGRRAVLRPSYVYAEDDEPIESLLGDVERQLRSGNSIAVDFSRIPHEGAKRAPVFFYLGVEGACGSDSEIRNVLATDLPERRVTVTAVDDGERAEVRVSARSATARALDLADFQRRYERTLSSLLAGRCSSAGELRGQLDDASEAPSNQLTEMQKRVIALWAKVLGIAEDDLTESSSYFEIGGTSLNAFKLVNRVRLEFQHDLSIRDIIENPTVQELARLLAKPRGA
jgi:acyl carrier protein